MENLKNHFRNCLLKLRQLSFILKAKVENINHETKNIDTAVLKT